MQRIHAHLPAAIKHLRWAYLSLIALLASMVSTSAHAAVRPATDAPDLHSSRDGVLRQAVRAVLTAGRQHSDRALALHRVRAGESLSADAMRYCHGQAQDWTGIYAASRAAHLTSANANVLNVGQLLAIDCVYKPGALRFAAPQHRWHPTVTTAYIGSGGHHDQFDGHHYPGGCGDGDGDGLGDMPCSMLHHSVYHGATGGYRHAGRSYRRITVYSGSRYSGGGGRQSCIIARESGGNSQVMNGSGHYGLYQFSYSTWVASGGSPSSFGHASVAEQNQAFYTAVAKRGYSDWAAYDGC